MLNIFNKKKDKKKYINTISGSGQTQKQKDDLAKKVVVHTMPERFFSLRPQAAGSRQTGVIILIGGIVLLIIIFGIAYIVLVKSETQSNINSEQTEAAPAVDVAKKSAAENEQAKNKNTPKPIAVENKNINPPGNIVENKTITEKQADDKNTNSGSEDIPTIILNKETETTTIDNLVGPLYPEDSTATTSENNNNATTTRPENEEIPVVAESENKAAEAIDSDGDGLSDAEELLLGSNKNEQDSDLDGFSDMSEVLNLYNPAGNGSIVVNNGIERYISDKFGYILYYPKTGVISQIGGEDAILIRMKNDQFFQINIQPDYIKTTLEEWYKEQFEVDYIKTSQKIFKPGWAGIRSDNGQIIYLSPAGSDTLYTLTYNLGIDNTLYYMNIFEIMIRSLELEN